MEILERGVGKTRSKIDTYRIEDTRIREDYKKEFKLQNPTYEKERKEAQTLIDNRDFEALKNNEHIKLYSYTEDLDCKNISLKDFCKQYEATKKLLVNDGGFGDFLLNVYHDEDFAMVGIKYKEYGLEKDLSELHGYDLYYNENIKKVLGEDYIDNLIVEKTVYTVKITNAELEILKKLESKGE